MCSVRHSCPPGPPGRHAAALGPVSTIPRCDLQHKSLQDMSRRP
ncbi:hypothetical protein LI99_32305 [Mycolicibacterium smegmatis]|uniref:Uncharacterized protein n=1 Tax=Mycolicibacterium smegmatis (strain ATCC 700084 / mc(2)155) TaxID=246196 RepID=A0R6F9_MYCS2|nr:hypothetical protein MSMEG_6534 [Mycolicibacterium smegmatis MC2 155]AIU18134.1 hypothetical protein LI99_32305 [Mycolicibacterium smegmatis]AIU11509.1 hypothetical protein LJ00_32300 [Mycolicibacterium smegmatis MC2 155]AIU24756.1 hypothetical protein LI98_32310 [Mycolicibacterium smegmatis]TBH30340.1 hypothetical protein EYS45_26795 [Mycolicibacterium smegmatis MC2 155]